MTESKYTYCFAEASEETEDGRSLGTGVNDESVSVYVEDGIGAVVHSCPAEAYDTDEREQAETWIKQHNGTIERAADELGPVLPLTFDTIFETEDAVRTFLADYSDQIADRLEVLAGAEEYGIRIYCEEDLLVEQPETPAEPEDTSGMAFFEGMKLEKQRQKELAESMKERFQSYFRRIDSAVDEITEEDLDEAADDERGRNVLTVSCLVSDRDLDELKRVLDEIDDEDGVTVVFTGPWLPYSFVGSLGDSTAGTGTDGA